MEQSPRSRLRAGDQSAFGELFDEHAQAVYGYALRTLGEWATAEDVVSLTFLEAWRLRGTLREEGGSVRPWLFGIATNVLRNTTRAARRHRAAMSRLPGREAAPTSPRNWSPGSTTATAWRPSSGPWAVCGAASGRSSGSASGAAWTTPPPPRRSASRSAPCAPACPGPGRGWRPWPNVN